jgi:hypothetical protein
MVLGIDVFESPKGREYALPWGDAKNKEQSGMLKMTDYLFNYYFFPVAFGADGAFYTRTYHESKSYTRTRKIGGPASASITRKAYTVRVTPTWKSGAYDAGTQLFAIDNKDLWNFEITGRLSEFRIWVRNCGRLGQLKRTLVYRTATGVGSGSLALAAGN